MLSSISATFRLPLMAARCRCVSPLSFFRSNFFLILSSVVVLGLPAAAADAEGDGEADMSPVANGDDAAEEVALCRWASKWFGPFTTESGARGGDVNGLTDDAAG
jgi:hypothetical protein